MRNLLRRKKLSKSLGELERFQKQELERLRIEIDLNHREQEGYFACAGKMAELLPGSQSLFRRVEESRQRILALEKKHSALQGKLLKTRAMLKAAGARTDQLEAQLERRELDRSLDSIVSLEAASSGRSGHA
ncbi:MAG: hypothetical protein HC855_00110 [Rhizobiales bacterium]|nr:hypothetical protein [Hyphomicrobiales bacterium]